MRVRGGLLALVLGLGFVAAGLGLVAQAASASHGFVISPAFQDVVIQDQQVRSQYELTLTNQGGADQLFRLSAVDFGSLDEAGGVAFLGTPANELEHKYGLALWMKLDKDTVLVPAGKSLRMTVGIENRPSLAPGGHYGAVLATAVTDAGSAASEPRVGVKQVLSSLVLVTKQGGARTNLDLVLQTSKQSWWRLPGWVEHRFENTGNVHVVPRGTVEVRDPGGQVVARGALNEESGVILPESFRRYKAGLTSVANAWRPGQYALVTAYRYDGTQETKTVTTNFWYAGALIVWLVGLGTLAAVASLGWWLWLWPRHRTRAR